MEWNDKDWWRWWKVSEVKLSKSTNGGHTWGHVALGPREGPPQDLTRSDQTLNEQPSPKRMVTNKPSFLLPRLPSMLAGTPSHWASQRPRESDTHNMHLCIRGERKGKGKGRKEAVIGEIFGHNRLRSQCLQVQPVTCSHPPVFLYIIGGIFYTFL